VIVKYGPGPDRHGAAVRHYRPTATGRRVRAEGTVFLALHGTTIWAPASALGSNTDPDEAGHGDVFLASFDDYQALPGLTWYGEGVASRPPRYPLTRERDAVLDVEEWNRAASDGRS